MRRLYPGFPGGTTAVGLLAVRLVFGCALLFHGWPKIQNPTGWMGPEAPVPGFLQAASAVAEFGGGVAWIFGLLAPLFSLLVAANMATALGMVHLKHGDPFVVVNMPGQPYQPSFELAAVYLSVALLLLLAGPGAISVDAALFGRKATNP